jgi:hypothetical protein
VITEVGSLQFIIESKFAIFISLIGVIGFVLVLAVTGGGFFAAFFLLLWAVYLRVVEVLFFLQ